MLGQDRYSSAVRKMADGDALNCDGMQYDKRNLGYVSMYRNVIYIGAVRNGDIHMLNMLWQNYSNFGLGGKESLFYAE